MVIFGDEDKMVERFVEIDARILLKAQHGNRTRRVIRGPQYSEKLKGKSAVYVRNAKYL